MSLLAHCTEEDAADHDGPYKAMTDLVDALASEQVEGFNHTCCSTSDSKKSRRRAGVRTRTSKAGALGQHVLRDLSDGGWANIRNPTPNHCDQPHRVNQTGREDTDHRLSFWYV